MRYLINRLLSILRKEEGCICRSCGRKYKFDLNIDMGLWNRINKGEKELILDDRILIEYLKEANEEVKEALRNEKELSDGS